MSHETDIEAIMRLKLEAQRLASRATAEDCECLKGEEREADRQLSDRVYAHGCVCPVGAERVDLSKLAAAEIDFERKYKALEQWLKDTRGVRL